ncbi:hypothetical protein BH11VER1_BH11VER1_30600 [soil metagenome]
MKFVIVSFWSIGLLLLSLGEIQAQQAGLMPVNPQPRTDKQGNEWYVEQNGLISRNGGGNSILSGAMMLMVGTEQFYCNQPMATPDGREMVLTGQQPMFGLQVTRYIRFLEKEGGMRYLEMFTNATARDITTTIELRQNFNGQVAILTNEGRANNGVLEKNESGIVFVPGSAAVNGYLFTICGPRSAVKPRIASQNQYQTSYFYTFTVPAGKSSAILHTVTQAKRLIRPDAADLEKLFKPFALSRHLKDLPKGALEQLINVRASSSGAVDLAGWFPNEILGVRREAVDVLAIGDGTRLRGRASCAKLSLVHRLGKVVVPWEKVIAIAGEKSEAGDSRIYLSDGQVLRGDVEAEELKFTLSNGLQMTLKWEELDRLVLASDGTPAEWPKGVTALMETRDGERWAMSQDDGMEFVLSTPWGSSTTKLGEIAALSSTEDAAPMTLATLRDGSKFRVWLGGKSEIPISTTLMGKYTLNTAQLKSMAVAESFSNKPEMESEDHEPLTTFADIAGEQRLVGVVADAQLHIVTSGGVVPLDPASIKEMRNVTEDIAPNGLDESPWFQLELWGGGSVMGQLRDSMVRFHFKHSDWAVPAQDIVRLVNPSPKLSDATLGRIGQLIRDLGHAEWKIREKATGELQALGEMARASLQEAFKQSEDAEVKHRIEIILGEME